MTLETVGFLLNLVNSLQLQAGAEDFDQIVAVVKQAKSELNAEIVRLTAPTDDTVKQPRPRK